MLIGIHTATAQRGPSEATTGVRIPPTRFQSNVHFRPSLEDPIRRPFRSLAERNEGGQRQDDGCERRELKHGPQRLPSCKCTVHICEDRLFGYPRAEPEQVRGCPGRRENVGQRERRSQVDKRGGGYGCTLVDNEVNPECDCEGWCSEAQRRIDPEAGAKVRGPLVGRHRGEADCSASRKFRHGFDAAANRLHWNVETIFMPPRLAAARLDKMRG